MLEAGATIKVQLPDREVRTPQITLQCMRGAGAAPRVGVQFADWK
jgi:hypothetical protein